MNSQEFEKYIEHRIQEWAIWFSGGSNNGLGFPPHTIEHRLMTEAIIEKSKGQKPLPCNEDAEEIEFLISEMAKQNIRLAYAIRIHYLTGGSLRDKSRQFLISRAHLKLYTDMARQWITGRLSAFSKSSSKS